MKEQYDRIIPPDWGQMENVEIVGDMQTEGLDEHGDAIGWLYVSLEGSIYPYSEGLYVQVARIHNNLYINDVWFGRP
jgi:hypothetical protein